MLNCAITITSDTAADKDAVGSSLFKNALKVKIVELFHERQQNSSFFTR